MDEVTVVDARMEPFVRMTPEEAGEAGEALMVLAYANRAEADDSDVPAEADVLRTDAERQEQLAGRLTSWAAGWAQRAAA